jgi:cytoskeletal protein CcmA (bactofilin family)
MVLVIFAVFPAHALEVRHPTGEAATITIPAGETIDDTLVALADTITIDGIVTGNVITLARHVEVNGEVQGDLICGAQRVLVSGEVDGNVLAFGRAVDLRGATGQSIHAFGEDIRFEETARAGGDVLAFGSELGMRGIVGRDALLFSGSADVRGTIGRDLTSRSGKLTIADSAKIGGDLTAHAKKENQVRIASGATVAGAREVKLPDKTDKAEEDEEAGGGAAFVGAILWKLFGIATAFISGLVLFWLWPAAFASRLETPTDLAKAMGIGFLCLVATPVAGVLLMVTLIGLPVGLLTLFAWIAAVYLACIIVAAVIGSRMLRKPSGKLVEFAIALLAGLVVLAVATSIPFLGVLVRFLAVLFGLGLLWTSAVSSWRGAPTGPTGSP